MRAVLLLANKLDWSQSAGKMIDSPDRSGIFSGVGDVVSVAVGANMAVSEGGAAVGVGARPLVETTEGAGLGLQAVNSRMQANQTRNLAKSLP